MITLLSAFGFIVGLGFLWVKTHGSFPALARRYLWIAPFLPLIGLLNHNIDHDRFGPPVMLVPVYVLLGLTCLSLLQWLRRLRYMRVGSTELFLGLYALVTLLQVPLSTNPIWSLTTWSWTVPGYFLFLIAGRFTSLRELSVARGPFLAFLGFIGINLGLIAVGLLTGRAENLFLTRNLGSFYASTAMLLFLSLFAGLAWLGVASSRLRRALFFQASLLAILFSFSRTTLMVLPLFASFLIDRARRRPHGRLLAGLATVAAILAVYSVLNRSDIGMELASLWDQRFAGWRVWESIIDARAIRSEEFAGYRRRIFSETLVLGWGFGTFRSFSSYADAHNLFVTEALENGLLAALLLLLSFSIPRAVLALKNKQRRPIAASILTFIVIAHVTGGMLSNRALGQYYSALPGWALFFLIGCLNPARQIRSAADTLDGSAPPDLKVQ